MRSVLPVLAVVLLSACPRANLSPEQDAGTDEVADAAIVDAGVDAGPPASGALELIVEAALVDGGVAAITRSASEVAPATGLTVGFPVALADFRVRLLDHRDQVVASDDELAADGRSYRIVPLEPLKPGRSYRLLVDAEIGAAITDPTGRALDDWELEFRISGEPQPDPGQAPKKPGKRRPKTRK